MDIDEKIIAAYDVDDIEQLVKLLKEASVDQLRKCVDSHVMHQSDSGPLRILQAIFRGCRQEKNHLSCHALAIFTHCLRLIHNPDSNKNPHTDILDILMLEVNQLSTGGLVDSSKLLIDMIRSGETGKGRAIEIIPKILTLLEQKPEVHIGPGQGSMSGYEYKKHLINSLCSGKWSNQSVIHLARVFKDVPMSQDELRFFLQKMFRQLELLDLQEIPPLVNQMLSLAGTSHHETLLRGLFSTFVTLNKNLTVKGKKSSKDNDWDAMFEENDEDTQTANSNLEKELKSVEGKVLLHLTNMSRWDQTLGKTFIKILKLTKEAISEESISTLSFAFALCLAQTKIFREQVLDVLKTIIFRCFSHQYRESHSNWLKQRSVTVPDVRNILQNIITNCKNDWDQSVSGIMYLGFCLMDAYAPKAGAFGRPLEGEPVKEDNAQQACRDLGGHLVACIFKGHQNTRKEIIEHIINRVIIKTSTPIRHYIDVLKGISKRYPETLMDCNDKLKEFFDHICLLSPSNAGGILQALLPLIKMNSNLKDSLILVLRKALFSSQVNGRIIACNGFLLMLQSFKVKGYVSLSQASSQSSLSIFSLASQILNEKHSLTPNGQLPDEANHEPLCLEVLSSLRRCLTQQAPVRSTLYQGLWNVIGKNPHLAGPILEKLLQHFRKFYEERDGVLPPLKTALCIKIQDGEPVLVEPLPLLMSAIFLCLKKGQDCQKKGGLDDDDLIDDHLVTTVHAIFESMTSRMTKSAMEDFELDKSAEFSQNSGVGKKNSLLANLVMGCYHSMIEYNFLQDEINEETANHILRLHACYKKIRDLCSGGKKDATKTVITQSHAKPVFVKILIDRLLNDGSPDNEVGLNVLRCDEDFMKYAMEITQQTVSNARDFGVIKGIGGQDKVCIREMCIMVGHSCLKKFMEIKSEPSASVLSQSCLQIFHIALQYIVTRKRKRLEEFLTSASANMDDITSTRLNIQDKHVRRLQRIVISFLSEDVTVSVACKKIIPLLISILETLSFVTCDDMKDDNDEDIPQRSSTPYPSGIKQINEWVGKICNEKIIDDNNITKCLLSLHLRLSTACGPWTGMDRAAQGSEGATRDVAKDIHHVAGDIDQDEESRMDDGRKRGFHYSAIDECNVITLVPLIVNHIDSSVEETEWLLQRVKGQVAFLLAEEKVNQAQSDNEANFETEFHKKRRKLESAMCTRLGNLLIAYREFVLSPLSLGPPSDSTFRGLTKLFNLLTNFTKYYTWIVSQGVSKTPMPRFEKLVKLTGTEVTRYIYPFINHIEGLQSCRSAQTAKKRKRKDDKENATNAEKLKVLRETKSIPPLIYAIENLERFLMALGKKCKIDLLSGHKLPTSRDFRIKSALVKEALARREEEDGTQETQVP